MALQSAEAEKQIELLRNSLTEESSRFSDALRDKAEVAAKQRQAVSHKPSPPNRHRNRKDECISKQSLKF